MKNKILISLLVPEYEIEIEFYIPNNKKIGTIKKYLIKALEEILQEKINKNELNLKMIDKLTGTELQNNVYVKDSRIKNGSTILLI